VSENTSVSPSQTAGLMPPWQPGQTGNPNGRPKGTGYKQLALGAFASLISGEEGKKTLERFIDNYRNAINKEGTWQAKQFAERLFQENIVDQLEEWVTRGQKRDLAFLRYQIYLDCFDEQREALLTQKPWIINIGGRRAGKTRGWSALLSDRAIAHDKGVALYLGRTAKSAFEMIWNPTIETLKNLGVQFTPHISTQSIAFPNGVEIQVRGRNTKEDVENLRGKPIFLAIVDEIQSDQSEKLRYIVKDILEPAGRDFTDSQIALGGTPPRVPGNYAEEMFLSNRKDICRLSWNLSVNRHIPESERDLEKTRIEKGFAPTDPTWQREYLGIVGSYDTEALVFKIEAANHYEEVDLRKWIDSQPITDIFLAGGLDYGFDDFNSAAVIMASESRGERFLLAEYKGHRQSTSDFGNELKRITQMVVSNPHLQAIPNKKWTWFCDTEGLGKQLTHDLAAMYSIPVQPAYQGQSDLMVEMLQDDIRQARFRVHSKQVVSGVEIIGEFEQETYKIVFERDDQDRLTRRIDDDTFHPEITKSVLYAMRYAWLKSRVKAAGGST
jgi:hypothetical protein